jgi:hypothetical protein
MSNSRRYLNDEYVSYSHWECGSGSGRAKMTNEKRKKVKKVYVLKCWSAGCSLLRAERIPLVWSSFLEAKEYIKNPLTFWHFNTRTIVERKKNTSVISENLFWFSCSKVGML